MPAPAEQTPESIRQRIDSMSLKQPALEPLLKSFGRVREAIAACRASLPEPDVSSAGVDADVLHQGVPLLEQNSSLKIDFHLAQAAEILLPAVAEAFPALAGAVDKLRAALQEESALQSCEAAMAGRDEDCLPMLAADLELAPEILGFLLECLGKPALESLSEALSPLLDGVAWTVWNRGNCPVCGGGASMSVLKLGPGENSEFLKNVSAQRWLCCSDCAHTWRISRTLCPSCGYDEREDREYLHVEGRDLERVEICKHCNHYLLSVDIRERSAPLDHRLAPLSLAHLDMIARDRGFAPQTESLWAAPGMGA